jgi:hypothetical protein
MKAFAVILIKGMHGEEKRIQEVLATLETAKDGHVCLTHKDVEGHPCASVRLVDVAYAFGSFDFLLVTRADDVSDIQEFVVDCLRGASDVVADTQTLLGISLLNVVPTLAQV